MSEEQRRSFIQRYQIHEFKSPNSVFTFQRKIMTRKSLIHKLNRLKEFQQTDTLLFCKILYWKHVYFYHLPHDCFMAVQPY